MNDEQLSFLQPTKKPVKESKICGLTICSGCLCDKCKYNVEITPFLSKEECKEFGESDSCFNCDDCYYYGMDNENLSRTIVRFECDKFEMTNYYAELEAKTRRRRFKIV